MASRSACWWGIMDIHDRNIIKHVLLSSGVHVTLPVWFNAHGCCDHFAVLFATTINEFWEKFCASWTVIFEQISARGQTNSDEQSKVETDTGQMILQSFTHSTEQRKSVLFLFPQSRKDSFNASIDHIFFYKLAETKTSSGDTGQWHSNEFIWVHV